MISSALASASTANWLATLQVAGVAAVEPAGYNNVNFMCDPANAATGPGRGLRGPGWPHRARAGPAAAGQRQQHGRAPPRPGAWGAHRPAPDLGGYGPEEIAELKSRNVIG